MNPRHWSVSYTIGVVLGLAIFAAIVAAGGSPKGVALFGLCFVSAIVGAKMAGRDRHSK